MTNAFINPALFLLLLLLTANGCVAAEIQDYREQVVLQGAIGSDSLSIGLDTTMDGEPKFTFAFAVVKDGSIWIDDPVHKAIKHYSVTGKLVRQIHTDTLIVDDMTALEDLNLAVDFWNSSHVVVYDTSGNALYTCKLPHSPFTMTYLHPCTNDLYVDFVAHDSIGSGRSWNVSLRYDGTGSLLERRYDSLQLWAATCGNYYTADTAVTGTIVAQKILRRNGQNLIATSDTALLYYDVLGVDSARCLFLVQAIGKSYSPESYLIHKYSAEGLLVAKIDIQDRYNNQAHWIRLDKHGNIYVFWPDEKSREWRIYKYGPQ